MKVSRSARPYESELLNVRSRPALDPRGHARILYEERRDYETHSYERKRQVRDLQFELANIKIANLRRRNKNASLNEEQIKGFDAFEANMKRSGLGGNDGDANMSVSYEDMDNFT